MDWMTTITGILRIVTDFAKNVAPSMPTVQPNTPVVPDADGKVQFYQSPTIKVIQRVLNNYGGASPKLDEDGFWGPKTDAAVMAALKSYGFV